MSLFKKVLWESADYLVRSVILLFLGIYPTKGFLEGKVTMVDFYTSAVCVFLLLWVMAHLLGKYALQYNKAQKVNPDLLPPDWVYLECIVYSSLSLAYMMLGKDVHTCLLAAVPSAICWTVTSLIYGLPKWRWAVSIQRWLAFMPAALLIAGASVWIFLSASLVTMVILWKMPQVHTTTTFLGAPITKPDGLFWVRWANVFAISGISQRFALNKWELWMVALAACWVFLSFAFASGTKERTALFWGYLTSVAAGFLAGCALGVISLATSACLVCAMLIIWVASRLTFKEP